MRGQTVEVAAKYVAVDGAPNPNYGESPYLADAVGTRSIIQAVTNNRCSVAVTFN